jgi:hypothetical protein
MRVKALEAYACLITTDEPAHSIADSYTPELEIHEKCAGIPSDALLNWPPPASLALPYKSPTKYFRPVFTINRRCFFRSYVKLIRARRISPAFAARSSGAGSMAASGEKKR